MLHRVQITDRLERVRCTNDKFQATNSELPFSVCIFKAFFVKFIMGVVHYIAVLVGFLFLFAGLLKLVPIELGHGMGQTEMKAMFKRYLSVLPIKQISGVTITTTLYRSAVGFAETIFGSMLAFGRTFWRVFGAFYLLLIMIGACITHYQIGDPIAMASPPIILGLVLAFILINRRGLSTNFRSSDTKSKSD